MKLTFIYSIQPEWSLLYNRAWVHSSFTDETLLTCYYLAVTTWVGDIEDKIYK